MEIVSFDSEGHSKACVYGSLDGPPPFTPTPGLDFDRMGWTEHDQIVIGELESPCHPE